MASVFAVSVGANFEFGLFLLIALFGLVLGYYTVRGSGINNHPWDGRNAPGARLPDEFHQFADRDFERREARRVGRAEPAAAREVPRPTPQTGPLPQDALVSQQLSELERLSRGRFVSADAERGSDDLTLDEVNERLAADSPARTVPVEDEA